MKTSLSKMNVCIRGLGVVCLLSVMTGAPQAQTLKPLYRFLGKPKDGFGPVGGVFVDTKGTVYGTTEFGGTNCELCGTIFSIRGGKQEWVYSFKGLGSDGAVPLANLVMGSGDTLYGTTQSGGEHSCAPDGTRCGTVFSVTTAGKETVLYSFQGGTDGAQPNDGTLWMDSSGNLHGITTRGGNPSCAGGCGTVFELAGTSEKVLYRFCATTDCADGKNPNGEVVLDSAGNIYGTAAGGMYEKGMVFKLSPGGTVTVLHSFCSEKNCADGQLPAGNLILDTTAGTLYGITSGGGTGTACPKGCGILFALNADGKDFKLLHSFTGAPDGSFPEGGLTGDGAGNLYGVTLSGGGGGGGTVFEYSATNGYKLLWSFSSRDRSYDGWQPTGKLAFRAGKLYGTTNLGGHASCQGGAGCGIVFELTP